MILKEKPRHRLKKTSPYIRHTHKKNGRISPFCICYCRPRKLLPNGRCQIFTQRSWRRTVEKRCSPFSFFCYFFSRRVATVKWSSAEHIRKKYIYGFATVKTEWYIFFLYYCLFEYFFSPFLYFYDNIDIFDIRRPTDHVEGKGGFGYNWITRSSKC